MKNKSKVFVTLDDISNTYFYYDFTREFNFRRIVGVANKRHWRGREYKVMRLDTTKYFRITKLIAVRIGLIIKRFLSCRSSLPIISQQKRPCNLKIWKKEP